MSGALCIRYGRTLLLLCKKCGRDRPRTGAGISRFGTACCFRLRLCFRAGRRKSRRDLRETGGKEGSFFPPAAFRTRLPGRRLHRLPAFLRRLGRRLLQGKNLLCIGVVRDSAAYHTCFAEFRRCRWRGPAPIASGMPFFAARPPKAGCCSSAAPKIDCCSRCQAALQGFGCARGQSCFGCFRRNCTCPPAHFPTCPPSAPRRQRLGKVTLAHHIVDIRLLLGAVGVPVHPARTAVIAGLQLCQRIVVVLLQQIAAVCICSFRYPMFLS